MKKYLLLVAVLVLAITGWVGVLLVYHNKTVAPEVKTPEAEEVDKPNPVKTVSFGAVGDNLIHGAVYLAAATGGGAYDFRPFYANVRDEIMSVDVAYINQETPFAGASLGLSSYPTFNGPTEIMDAVADAGFDWVNTASNHSFDRGAAGVDAGLAVLDKFENVVQTGEARSTEEFERVKYIEREGVKFGLESFTYGLNGFQLPDDRPYMVNLIDDALIRQRVEKLNAETDVQLVSMHWGTEYATAPNAEQERLAQLLADLGVEVVAAEHPHVIQPVRWVSSTDGAHKTLVIYSMGNFLSAQDEPFNMLGLYVKWAIRYNVESRAAEVTGVEIWPTVTWQASGFIDYRCTFLRDYTAEMAGTHNLRAQGTSREYFIGKTQGILGEEFKVVY
ncbi:MAG: CapA family protein [Candidatus Nomurabacteria bacterium]|jgi:poly-gamma-glutamate synthesis protein (capsule biosynthesis protein)|nr:CapA family protein [Candidatus Nomurabacteria bacterium]